MSKHFGFLAVLLSAVVAFAAVPATSVAAPGTAAVKLPGRQAVFGVRGFGRARPASRYRGTRSPYTRPYARRSPFHGFGGTILKALGIAYLFHALFGIGAGGGSPLGLLLLVALLAYVVGRTRGRPRRPSYR
jgi:hypothetical protein